MIKHDFKLIIYPFQIILILLRQVLSLLKLLNKNLQQTYPTKI